MARKYVRRVVWAFALLVVVSCSPDDGLEQWEITLTQPTEIDGAIDFGRWPNLIRTDRGLLAVGSPFLASNDPTGAPVVATSTDGVRWRQETPSIVGIEPDASRLYTGLQPRPGGGAVLYTGVESFVSAGDEFSFAYSRLYSADGIQWEHEVTFQQPNSIFMSASVNDDVLLWRRPEPPNDPRIRQLFTDHLIDPDPYASRCWDAMGFSEDSDELSLSICKTTESATITAEQLRDPSVSKQLFTCLARLSNDGGQVLRRVVLVPQGIQQEAVELDLLSALIARPTFVGSEIVAIEGGLASEDRPCVGLTDVDDAAVPAVVTFHADGSLKERVAIDELPDVTMPESALGGSRVRPSRATEDDLYFFLNVTDLVQVDRSSGTVVGVLTPIDAASGAPQWLDDGAVFTSEYGSVVVGTVQTGWMPDAWPPVGLDSIYDGVGILLDPWQGLVAPVPR